MSAANLRLPELVAAARATAERAGFDCSCDHAVGQLLAVLATAVAPGGRILELGTGAGVGTAWIVHGLAQRSDVEVISVEADPQTAALAARHAWPRYVRFLLDDAVRVLPTIGTFDLIFADAQGGKWQRLDLTIRALRARGMLLVDDMTPQHWWSDEQATHQDTVRRTLLQHPDLASCQLDCASGIILSVRRAHPGQG